MATMEKVWQFGLWTCAGSSDAVTAGMDAVDRWGAIYDGTKIVRAAGAVAHSWIVLKSPVLNGANWYLTIDFNSASDATTRFVFAKAAPTGGSIAARPTSTQEWHVRPDNTIADQTLNDGASASSRLHAGMSTDGGFYMNLVVELVAGSGVYSIFDFADVNNPLLLGVYSTPGPNLHRCVWTAGAPSSGVMVVNDQGMATFPIPPRTHHRARLTGARTDRASGMAIARLRHRGHPGRISDRPDRERLHRRRRTTEDPDDRLRRTDDHRQHHQLSAERGAGQRLDAERRRYLRGKS